MALVCLDEVECTLCLPLATLQLPNGNIYMMPESVCVCVFGCSYLSIGAFVRTIESGAINANGSDFETYCKFNQIRH